MRFKRNKEKMRENIPRDIIYEYLSIERFLSKYILTFFPAHSFLHYYFQKLGLRIKM